MSAHLTPSLKEKNLGSNQKHFTEITKGIFNKDIKTSALNPI